MFEFTFAIYIIKMICFLFNFDHNVHPLFLLGGERVELTTKFSKRGAGLTGSLFRGGYWEGGLFLGGFAVFT